MKSFAKIFSFILTILLVVITFTGCNAINKIRCGLIGHSIILYGAVLPTCTEDGLSGYAICEICNHLEKSSQSIPATGHAFSDATCTQPKTCQNCGVTEGNVLEHIMISINGKDPSCVDEGYSSHLGCENCDYTENKEIIPAKGHSLIDVSSKNPTCDEDGYSSHKVCENCDYTENKEVFPATHSFGSLNENGSRVCVVCNAIGVSTFDGLLDAINGNASRIVLEADIKFEDSIAIKNCSIDGGNHTVTASGDFKDAKALIYVEKGSCKIEKIKFDGINTESVISLQKATLEIDECIFSHCANAQGVVYSQKSDVSITYSTFNNNTSKMLINFNEDITDKIGSLRVKKCLISQNSCSGIALISYVAGRECVIEKNSFIDNTINTDSSYASTVYLGFTTGNKIVGNLFYGNKVTAPKSTSNRVSGGIFFGYEAVFEGNAFIENEASNLNGTNSLGQSVCVSLFFTDIDLSGNYWSNGNTPIENVDYLVQYEDVGTVIILEDYATEMELEPDGIGVDVK